MGLLRGEWQALGARVEGGMEMGLWGEPTASLLSCPRAPDGQELLSCGRQDTPLAGGMEHRSQVTHPTVSSDGWGVFSSLVYVCAVTHDIGRGVRFGTEAGEKGDQARTGTGERNLKVTKPRQ